MRTSSRPRGTASRRAYDFAKWAILNAVYPGGELVTVGALANELGMSRLPVRDALLRLEAEGLVCMVPGRGAVVSSFSADEVDDVLEARAMVENFTARRSFAERREFLPELGQIHELMRQRRKEGDTAGFTEADRLFHELIVDAAGNTVLSEMYRSLRERQTLFTSSMVRGRTDRMDAAIREHEHILEQLRGEDEAAFVKAVNAHLQWAVRLALESRLA